MGLYMLYKSKVSVLIFCLFFSNFFTPTRALSSTASLASINQLLEQANDQTSLTGKLINYTKALYEVQSFYEQSPLRNTRAFQLLESIEIELKTLQQNPELQVAEYACLQDAIRILQEIRTKMNVKKQQAYLVRLFICCGTLTSIATLGSIAMLWKTRIHSVPFENSSHLLRNEQLWMKEEIKGSELKKELTKEEKERLHSFAQARSESGDYSFKIVSHLPPAHENDNNANGISQDQACVDGNLLIISQRLADEIDYFKVRKNFHQNAHSDTQDDLSNIPKIISNRRTLEILATYFNNQANNRSPDEKGIIRSKLRRIKKLITTLEMNKLEMDKAEVLEVMEAVILYRIDIDGVLLSALAYYYVDLVKKTVNKNHHSASDQQKREHVRNEICNDFVTTQLVNCDVRQRAIRKQFFYAFHSKLDNEPLAMSIRELLEYDMFIKAASTITFFNRLYCIGASIWFDDTPQPSCVHLNIHGIDTLDLDGIEEIPSIGEYKTIEIGGDFHELTQERKGASMEKLNGINELVLISRCMDDRPPIKCTIAAFLSSCPMIKSLKLQMNLINSIEEGSTFSHVKKLELTGAKLSRSSPKFFQCFPNLKHLQLDLLPEDCIPDWSSLQQLEKVTLAFEERELDRVKSLVKNHLSHLPNLKHVKCTMSLETKTRETTLGADEARQEKCDQLHNSIASLLDESVKLEICLKEL